MARRADYTWEDDGEIVRVIDQNGRLSVTNDAENVIADLVKLGVPVDDRRVIYRDSDGEWCGLLTEGGVFSGFDVGTRDY